MRTSGFKKGGGFLNNVIGTITDYKFTDEAPEGKAGKKAKKKGEDEFNSLFVRLYVKLDGATDTVDTHLWAGSADDFEISEDGHSLSPLEEGNTLRAGTPFYRFIETLVESGFPETNFPETEIDFTAIIGARVGFKQQKDEDATKRLGKRKDAKTGKEYDRQELVVDKVLSYGKPSGKADAKAGKAAKAPAGGKGTKAAAAADEVDAAGPAAEALVRYATKAGEAGIKKDKLRMKVLTDATFKGNTQLREAVIKWLESDENLASVENVGYDDGVVIAVE
jgi:hypothetical protein